MKTIRQTYWNVNFLNAISRYTGTVPMVSRLVSVSPYQNKSITKEYYKIY